jgi:hypothetical protein
MLTRRLFKKSTEAILRGVLWAAKEIWGESGERISNQRKRGYGFSPYPPVFLGEPCRDRTGNLLIKSQLLYQLS